MAVQTPLLNFSVIEQLKCLSKGDDDTFLVELCERFVGNSADTLQIMTDAAQRGDHEHVSRLSHRLCGSALNVGATKVAALCHEWELRCRKGLPVVDKEITELEHLLARTRDALYANLLPCPKEAE
ncbi:MAG TPA: Hpt domain-containing protein [Myxococcales bacterium]|nr:Hpt domain-containing protein [Myxococcales bacterium]HIN86188.1 Hpt domain-containing protein [Myxococcales bacterium]